MRIRLPFAAAFFTLLLTSGYIGLTSLQPPPYINDKVLHLITFFLLTLTIYWIPDTTRRRTFHLTLFTSLSLSVFSEVLQSIIPNGRTFDAYDIVANVVGSLAAIGLCGWYHKRMLERRRRAKGYVIVSGEGEGEEDEAFTRRGTEDLELGEGIGIRGLNGGDGAQESGITNTGTTVLPKTTTLDQEVDNWDENAVDNWDDEERTGNSADGEVKTPSASSTAEMESGVGSDVKKGG